MNSEARTIAAQLAEGLRPRQVVAYNAKNGRVSVFKFGPNRKEESLQAVGWRVVHRYTPKAVKAAVQPVAPAVHIDQTTEPTPQKVTEAPVKRGRPFSKTDKP